MSERKLKPVCAWLPEKALKTLDAFVSNGLFPNRSEAVRQLICIYASDFYKLPLVLENCNGGNGSEMVLISLKVPRGLLDLVDATVKLGYFSSRAEVFRTGVVRMLAKMIANSTQDMDSDSSQ